VLLLSPEKIISLVDGYRSRLNVTGTATAGGGSIEVRSGGYWSPSVCPVTAISVIGATTGQAFTCWEYA